MKPEISPAQRKYLHTQKKHRTLVQIFRILILLGFIILWETAAVMGWIDSFIFSSPSRLCQTLWSMCADGSFFLHLGTTLFEVAISFVLICVIGYFSAVILWFFPKLSEILEPYFVVLNSLPKSALAPLLIVWLGANMRTIIVAGISVAIFGTILSLYTAFQEVDPDMIRLIYTLQGSKLHAMTKVIFPATLPTVISLMKVNIGLCLVGVVIGEFLAARQGLGYLIIYGSQVFQLSRVLLSITVLCLVAMGLYQLIGLLEKKLSGRFC